jgi:hypothetical protein
MTHADMHPATKARVDAGAALERKLTEYVAASVSNALSGVSDRYLQCKRAEYDAALELVLGKAIEEGAALAAPESGN